jgi:Peptidase family M23
MKLNSNSFLPGIYSYLNLNEWYLQHRDKITDTKVPKQIQEILPYFKYGGHGEDRKDVWKGTYLDETGGYIHLGIDIIAPRWTLVRAPFEAHIVDKFTDKDDKIGWGGRLIINFKRGYPLIVLAHMAPETMTDRKIVKQGEYLGNLGTWPTNGNTFHHLHVQCITHKDFRNFDGYGFESDLKDNPNPFEIDFQ